MTIESTELVETCQDSEWKLKYACRKHGGTEGHKIKILKQSCSMNCKLSIVLLQVLHGFIELSWRASILCRIWSGHKVQLEWVFRMSSAVVLHDPI